MVFNSEFLIRFSAVRTVVLARRESGAKSQNLGCGALVLVLFGRVVLSVPLFDLSQREAMGPNFIAFAMDLVASRGSVFAQANWPSHHSGH